ncbi:MAG: hypothetical protein KJO98_03405, partial [Rhodothermia bacterium]|nr:hypothetical protein [Rhodothermia bacterium]
NALNPAISVIGDFRAAYVSEGDRNIDFEMHEVESAFKSVVDPYARADVYISIAQEDGEIEFELEEAFLTTLSLPARLQLKAGKFRSAFGKINRIHPHALPYIDIPTVYANILGEEGLNDQGISVSWLVPNESFFQELTVEVTRGPGESASFETSETNRLLYAGRLRNFWDLTSNATLELGISGAVGPNGTGNSTYLGGVDLTYIWRPVRYNTYRSFMLQGEAILSSRDDGSADRVDAAGLYLLGQYKFARRWLVTGRFDLADLPDDADWNEQSWSVTLGWLTSEFQKIELGLKTTSGDDFDSFSQVLVRAVFVIGAHGAHEY